MNRQTQIFNYALQKKRSKTFIFCIIYFIFIVFLGFIGSFIFKDSILWLILMSVIFPLISTKILASTQLFNRETVDIFYYTVGIFGAIVFFLKQDIDRLQYEKYRDITNISFEIASLRQLVEQERSMISVLSDKHSNLEQYMSDIYEQIQLLQILHDNYIPIALGIRCTRGLGIVSALDNQQMSLQINTDRSVNGVADWIFYHLKNGFQYGTQWLSEGGGGANASCVPIQELVALSWYDRVEPSDVVETILNEKALLAKLSSYPIFIENERFLLDAVQSAIIQVYGDQLDKKNLIDGNQKLDAVETDYHERLDDLRLDVENARASRSVWAEFLSIYIWPFGILALFCLKLARASQ